jgi:spermidine/putrescine transport system permease protein
MSKIKIIQERLYSAFFIILLLFIFTPVILLVLFSFNQDKYPTLPWKGFTFGWYQNLLSNSTILEPLLNSLFIGISVSIICVFLGFIASNYIIRTSKNSQNKLLNISFIPALMPTILLGIAFTAYMNLMNFEQGIISIVLFQAVYLLPISIGLIYYTLKKIDPNLEQTCYDLGGSFKHYIFKVLIPLIKWNLLGVGLLIFTLSWDEFIISWFVSGFTQTISIKTWTMLKTAISPEINALGTIILLISMSLLIVSFILINRKVKQNATT